MNDLGRGDVPDETIQSISERLTDVVGLHGSWVMAIETYTDDGEATLMVVWDESGTRWQHIGLATVLLEDLRQPFMGRDEE